MPMHPLIFFFALCFSFSSAQNNVTNVIGTCGCWPVAMADCCLCDKTCIDDPWNPPDCSPSAREVLYFGSDGSPCVKFVGNIFFSNLNDNQCSYYDKSTVCSIPGNKNADANGGSGGSQPPESETRMF